MLAASACAGSVSDKMDSHKKSVDGAANFMWFCSTLDWQLLCHEGKRDIDHNAPDK